MAPRSSHSAIASRTVLHNHLRLRWSFMGKYRGHNYSREFSREVQFLLWQGEVTEWSNGQHVHWGPGVRETWGTDQLAPPVDWSVIWPRNVQNTVHPPPSNLPLLRSWFADPIRFAIFSGFSGSFFTWTPPTSFTLALPTSQDFTQVAPPACPWLSTTASPGLLQYSLSKYSLWACQGPGPVWL